MSRKLKVEELESRIAPSVGLWSFVQELLATDSPMANVLQSVVDQNTGDVDVSGAVDAANSAFADAGTQFSAVRDTFTLSDSIVISNKTADAIRSLFG
ncbi:MAG: hypothetical protein D6718_07250 [Acidobacteria bacterium]|nr:MAG: hypothetical protein D6718_07250 [Acidobacteriota bacterium]